MFTDAVPTETTSAETERFTIDSEEKANWLLGKLANIRAEQARINAQAAKRNAELEADFNGLMGRFGADLETFARGEANRRKRRTVTLMQGTLAFRATPSRLVIEEMETAIITARAVAPETVTTEEVTRLDRDAFLKRAAQIREETGEIIAGVKQTESSEAFSVKLPGAKTDD